jgi:hypothetical protein
MNPAKWAPWMKFYEAKGYTCYAPPYAYHEGDPTYLRTGINPQVGTLTFKNAIAGKATSDRPLDGLTCRTKDFKEFPGRTHCICGQPNWEEVAEFISVWIENLK